MKPIIRNMAGRAAAATLALVAVVGLAAALLSSVAPGLMRQAQAAVTNYAPSIPVYMTPIQVGGAVTATITPVKFKMPFKSQLIGFSGAARTLSGTFTIDFKVGGTSILASPLTVSTSVSEAVISTAAIADEAEVTLVLTVTGASPTGSDFSFLPVFVRN